MDDVYNSDKILSDWLDANAGVYSKFKQNLEKQLSDPYWKNILDLNGEEAEPLKSVLVNIASASSDGNFYINRLFVKAVKNNDVSAFCLYIYISRDKGLEHLNNAMTTIVKDPNTLEIVDFVVDYKRFYNYNRHHETTDISNESSDLLTLRRWHYDHPEEYSKFIAIFEKAYDGDMTFFQNNVYSFIEMLSLKGVKGIIKLIACFIPGNNHYKQRLFSNDGEQMSEKLSKILNSSLNNENIRQKVLRRNPYFFSLIYWLMFDDGFLHAADLLSHNFLGPNNQWWQQRLGTQAVRSLIRVSIDKTKYTKAQWMEETRRLDTDPAKIAISTTLHETRGRRGRSRQYSLFEEMINTEHVTALIKEVDLIMSEWKKDNNSDTILVYIFVALDECGLLKEKYLYRTFHNAMREKFPNQNIKEGYDYAEAEYYAIQNNGDGNSNISISEQQITTAKKIIEQIKIRILIAVTPDTTR